jgi:hypothetical protein
VSISWLTTVDPVARSQRWAAAGAVADQPEHRHVDELRDQERCDRPDDDPARLENTRENDPSSIGENGAACTYWVSHSITNAYVIIPAAKKLSLAPRSGTKYSLTTSVMMNTNGHSTTPQER